MSFAGVRRGGLGLALLIVAAVVAPAARGAGEGQAPSDGEVADLLRREPITVQTWPAWRGRLLAWIGDRRHATDAAYDAARAFARSQADAQGEISGPLAGDALVWYLLGSAYLYEARTDAADAGRAERALRRSLQLDPGFARAHRNLALALSMQAGPANAGNKAAEAERQIDEAHRLDPALRVTSIHAQAASLQKQFGRAEDLYKQALREDPEDVDSARGLASAVVQNEQRTGPRAQAIEPLTRRFPNDGLLACLHALALAGDDEPRAAVRELQRARQVGAEPEKILSPKLVEAIESAGAPPWWETAAWILAGFALFYLFVMAVMSLVGIVLAGRTRGSRALDLLDQQPDELVAAGQVVRTRHESGLAKLYALALFGGLILFYLSIPFVVVGLLGGTALLLYLIFMLPRIPVKLVLIVIVIGLGGVWAVLKSLFASPGKGSFGLAKTKGQCPRLYGLVDEVAHRVDTDPADEVYLAPGSTICVHQEGRGPFGMFGVKRRVLTLGLSTLHFLSADELRSILAHEYAHFSHRDTFYSRFIYQVTLSIEEALSGMGRAGGKMNYVNPFFWFLYLYYKAYNLLAAGHSRSREFLADRMASSLYGSDVFTSALTKVSTDGSLFEMTIYGHIDQLLGEGKAFVNMYSSFRSLRDEQLTQQERDDLYQKLLAEKESLFASHPTFGERIEAVKALPSASRQDTTPAIQLFENPEEIEKELTEFLTSYLHYVRQLQAQAGAAG